MVSAGGGGPQFGRAYANEAGRPYRDEIDGKAEGAWRLPVQWSDDDLEFVPADLRPSNEYSRQVGGGRRSYRQPASSGQGSR